MRTLADAWYISGPFLGIAGLVVGIASGAAGVWAAFRAANPRQELACVVVAIVPFLTEQSKTAREGLEIRLNGEILKNPQVVEIILRNLGRRDIATDTFDQGRPLRLDVAAPILKIREIRSEPSVFKAPRVEVDNTALSIGPDLLKRGQSVFLSLLIDGPSPQVTFPEPPLRDVEIKKYQNEKEALSNMIEMTVNILSRPVGFP